MVKLSLITLRTGLILAAVLTVTNCSNHKEPDKTFHSLDSSGSQTNSGTIPLNMPEFRHHAKKGDFDVNPDVLISDNSEEVKEILLDIKLSDQSRRDSLHKALDKNGDYSSEVVRRCVRDMKLNDSVNQIVLTRIFEKYGWPSVQIFGQAAAEAAYLVLIHSDLHFQVKYIGLLEKAVKKRDGDALSYAILVDRILKEQGKKQMYGTHGFIESKSKKIVLLPIENESEVNGRRAELGLPKLATSKCDMLIFE